LALVEGRAAGRAQSNTTSPISPPAKLHTPIKAVRVITVAKPSGAINSTTSDTPVVIKATSPLIQ
jgi:hypothetical protein